MKISKQTIDKLIDDCWNKTKEKVERGHPCSSEKTLVFLFAMELIAKSGNRINIDFENQSYKNLKGGSKYLDLLFFIDKKFKVAVEFKFPKKSKNSNSNQTQTRRAVYKDIGRLIYLKRKKIVSASYFLMATNEEAYTVNRKFDKYPKFITSNKHKVLANNSLSIHGIRLRGISFKFDWVQKEKYSWLEPIKIEL